MTSLAGVLGTFNPEVENKVKDALRDFRALATSNGVAPLFIDIIGSRLRELSPDIFAPNSI